MTTEATVSINGAPDVPCIFIVDVAQIDVSASGYSEPDPTWEFVDAAGHYHAFGHEGELLTIISRAEPREDEPAEPTTADGGDWDDFGDSYPEARSHCLLCDEVIEPRWRYISTPFTQYAPGRTSYRLTLHSPIPPGRFSVKVTVGEQVLFGFAEGHWIGGEREDTHEVWCGPMSRRVAA